MRSSYSGIRRRISVRCSRTSSRSFKAISSTR
ncbi:MAG: hypothetical protein KDA96_01780 [Planctomycetaceae bacterium]|nr:hypothetical protein [Planctomycetaceae bacterium]